MKKIDTSVFVGNEPGRIKPEKIDLGSLPPIAKPPHREPPENLSVARTHERTKAQTFNRTDEQLNESSSVHDYRIIIRCSYDVFIDQRDKIDELVLKRKKQSTKNVTKGEVMQEIIDFYFERNK